MLDFPESFFKEEVREGYLVSEMMKRAWASQMELLEALKELLDKYGLSYYAECGTLLGCVRHGGYIPWDDDFDIAMSRKDFKVLLEHADEIGEGLEIRSVYNSEVYMNGHAVLTHKAEKLVWDDERYEKYHKCPFICFIDIFPWDYVPRDPQKFKVQKQLYSFAYKLAYDTRDIELNYYGGRTISYMELRDLQGMNGGDAASKKTAQELISNIRDLEKYYRKYLGKELALDKKRPLRQQLFIAADTIAQMCDEKDADSVDYGPNLATASVNYPREKAWVKETSVLPFEFTNINVPSGYHDVLKNQYCESYMTPERVASAHGYPFFRDEIRVLIGGDTGDNVVPLEKEISEESIPLEWRRKLVGINGQLKRIVLYGLSATDIVNNGTVGLKHIQEYLTEMNGLDDVVVICFAPSELTSFMKRCELSLLTDYEKLLEIIAGMDNVIFDSGADSELMQAVMAICDEYYGDDCRLMELCREWEIPVTMQVYQ